MLDNRSITIISVVIALLCSMSCSYDRNDFIANSCKFFNLEDSIPIRQYNEFRESITFILGEDKELDNPYYAEAAEFYRFNNKDRTEYVIIHCRSLTEVQEYLLNNPPYNNTPWGLINLVTHGNQWVGMSVAVHPDLKRATAERIRVSIEEGYFTEFNDSIIDSKTRIYIHGCGIGNNFDLVNAVSEIFSNDDIKPVIRASKLYEYYTSIRNGNMLIESQRYMAKVCFAFYKMGYKPDNEVLISELSEKYPKTGINWQEVVKRDVPRWPGDDYYYTFEVPIKWIKKYLHKDSLPDISTEEKKLKWIKKQPELVETVNKTDIPIEKFNWWFRTIYYKEDGMKKPAVWLKGYATVFCVIKPLMKDVNDTSYVNRPFVPSVNDTTFYHLVNVSNDHDYFIQPLELLISDLIKTGIGRIGE